MNWSAKTIVGVLLVSLCFAQLLIDSSTDGVISTALVAGGILGGLLFFFDREYWIKHPIPSLTLAGYWMYYFACPLTALTFMLKPVHNNLEVPIATFFHAFYTQAGLILCFWLYRSIYDYLWYPKLMINFVSRWLGWFSPPSTFQVWVFGFIGILAGYYASASFENPSQGGGILVKFLSGYGPYIAAPFLLTIRRLWDPQCSKSLQLQDVKYLILHAVAVVVIGLVRNSRAAVFESVFIMMTAFLFSYALSYIKVTSKQKAFILLMMISAMVVLPLLNDFATAMAVARQKRADSSPVELIISTVDAFMDKKAIADYGASREFRKEIWNEEYTGSLFLDRLCNVRYLDLSLYWSNGLNNSQKSLYRQFEWESILCSLPDPWLKALGVDVDKKYVTSMSAGDQLFFLATGDVNAIGGFRVGNLIGSAVLLFGEYVFIFPLGILAMVSWFVMDSITFDARWRGARYIPLPLIMMFFALLFSFTSGGKGNESVCRLASGILRGYPQLIVLYFFIYIITKKMESTVKLFFGK